MNRGGGGDERDCLLEKMALITCQKSNKRKERKEKEKGRVEGRKRGTGWAC